MGDELFVDSIRPRRKLAGKRINPAIHDVRGAGIPACAVLIVKVIEEIVENGRRAGDAGDVPHGRAVEIPHPDSHGEFRRVTKSPVVPEIRTGPGFARHWKIKTQRGFRAESFRAGVIVAENVGDQPGRVRVADALAGVLAGGGRHEAVGPADAQAGQAGVGVGQFEQARFRVADGQAESVVVVGRVSVESWQRRSKSSSGFAPPSESRTFTAEMLSELASATR